MRNDGGKPRRMARMAAVVCAGFLLVSGAGCASAPAPVPTSAAPTAAPIFASDEEALAAATEAYGRYQEMADQVTGDGGIDPERMAPFVSEDYFPQEVHQYDDYRDAHAHSVGNTTFLVASAQRMDYQSESRTSISLYICDDVSGINVLDESGQSLVSESRVTITPFEVSFVMNGDGTLVVDSRDVWKRQNFC
jgi:hypothetical protein